MLGLKKRELQSDSASVALRRLHDCKNMKAKSNPKILQFPQLKNDETAHKCGLVIRSEVEEEVTAPVSSSPVSPSVVSKKKWVLNVALGSAISFVDASSVALRPVVFLWLNLHIVSKGLLLLSFPLLASLTLLMQYPQIQATFVPNDFAGIAMFGLLYVSCGALMLFGAFLSVLLSQGIVKSLDSFAACGEYHFPSKNQKI